MALDRSRYARVIDLYVTGLELELKDGLVMWMQVLNPFERDEATHDAQVARARVALALKDPESGETAKLRALFEDQGRDAVIESLLDTKRAEAHLEVVDEMRSEEEWGAVIDVLQRGSDLATDATPEEAAAVERAATRYATELTARLAAQMDYERGKLEALDTESLWEDYHEWWVERRGGETGLAEYKVTEMWLSARACAGTRMDDGQYDHTVCEGHRVRAFETKDEVRGLPQALQEELLGALLRLEMSERDARFSARQGSSSASSPLPSEPAESTRSTPIGQPLTVPGPSLSP